MDEHPILASLDDLLSPATLSALEGRPIAAITRLPFASADSLSGSRFLAVETTGPPPGGSTGSASNPTDRPGPASQTSPSTQRYVVKRINLAWDWIMRATDDRHGRAARAWSTGLLDRLPPTIEHGVLACARDGDGFAILMRDLGDTLIPPGDAPLAPADNDQLLAAMADLHATFWEEPQAADPALGFCALPHHYAEFAPAVTAREAGGIDPIPPLIGAGWARLPDLMSPDAVAILDPLLADPAPLCAALARAPQTVIHGDWKLGNVGLRRGPQPRVVLLDWAVVGPAPAAVDLAWYLAVNSARLPVPKEAAIATYRAALARHLGPRLSDDWWAPTLSLALLGGFLQLGWPKLLGASSDDPTTRAREQAELAWWTTHIRQAAAHL